MAYYNPMAAYPQMGGYQMPYQQQTQQTQNGVIWVQGEAGAKSYLVAPNCTVPLWDSEKKVIYLKSADQAGMPSMKVLDYTIRGEEEKKPAEEYATKGELEALAEKVAALAKKKTVRPAREEEDDE